MVKVALLGATGQVGGTVLKCLLKTTQHDVQCSVRSQKKLLDQLASSGINFQDYEKRLKIFEGDLTNTENLQKCLDGVDVAFLCAAAFTSNPGCTIAMDQAEAVVAALHKLQTQRPSSLPARTPKLVVLSSAEVGEQFSKEIPWPIRDILYCANSYIYNDLADAERYLLGQSDFVSSVFVKPGGLSHDIARGHKVSEVNQQTWLSFEDLAGGMVEIAETVVDGDGWDGKSVSVTSPAGKAKVQYSNFPMLFRGLIKHFFPWTYKYIG